MTVNKTRLLPTLTEIFSASRRDAAEQRKQKEVTSLGNLRAGNTGVANDNGEVAGSCLRKAHLRQLSLDVETNPEHKHLMFDLGLANEDIIYNKLIKVLPEGLRILREEEIPIQWNTGDGTLVTGRPDVVVVDSGDIPVYGIELKSVHSLWTARDVLFGGKPKLSNLAQAAHYLMELRKKNPDMTYDLVYTAYSQLGQGMAGTSEGWVAKMFPAPGKPLSEYVEYTYYKRVQKEVWNAKSGKKEMKWTNKKVTPEEYASLPENTRDHGIKHINQFQAVYNLRFNSTTGALQYRNETLGATDWKDTIITEEGIRSFFDKAGRVPQEMGPRPLPVDAHGDKAGYTDCDYCPLKGTCDQYESQGYDKWIQEVRNISSSLNKE